MGSEMTGISVGPGWFVLPPPIFAAGVKEAAPDKPVAAVEVQVGEKVHLRPSVVVGEAKENSYHWEVVGPNGVVREFIGKEADLTVDQAGEYRATFKVLDKQTGLTVAKIDQRIKATAPRTGGLNEKFEWMLKPGLKYPWLPPLELDQLPPAFRFLPYRPENHFYMKNMFEL